jgi:hypothetical protein
MGDDLPIVVNGVVWKPRRIIPSFTMPEDPEVKRKRIRLKILDQELAKLIALDLINEKDLLRVLQMMHSPDEENFTMAEAIVEQLHEDRRLREQSLNGRRKSKIWKR